MSPVDGLRHCDLTSRAAVLSSAVFPEILAATGQMCRLARPPKAPRNGPSVPVQFVANNLASPPKISAHRRCAGLYSNESSRGKGRRCDYRRLFSANLHWRPWV